MNQGVYFYIFNYTDKQFRQNSSKDVVTIRDDRYLLGSFLKFELPKLSLLSAKNNFAKLLNAWFIFWFKFLSCKSYTHCIFNEHLGSCS